MDMASAGKLLQKMRGNPRDWRIDDLKVVADKYGIVYRQPGGSHVIFVSVAGVLSVPARRHIKPVYVRRFVSLIDALESKI